MPQLSVIIPAYNAGDFLKKSAGSVLSQSFEDLELIIVDDGSTDGTAGICGGLAAADRRVRVISQENAGVSAARNRAMEAAQGEYLAFVDADDSLEPEAYAAMFGAMLAHGCNAAACGYYEEHMDGTRYTRPAPLPSGIYTPALTRRGIVLPLLQDRLSADLLLGTVWRYLFRRDVIMENGIRFSGAYLEDELFLIEYFSHDSRLAVVDEPLYNYLQNPQSVTRRHLDGFADNFEITLGKKEELVQRFSLPVSRDWRLNSAWAGLLIAVSNEFAPGGSGSAASVRELCARPLFREALENYRPRGMSRNKTVAAALLRRHMYPALAALYRMKNGRG